MESTYHEISGWVDMAQTAQSRKPPMTLEKKMCTSNCLYISIINKHTKQLSYRVYRLVMRYHPLTQSFSSAPVYLTNNIAPIGKSRHCSNDITLTQSSGWQLGGLLRTGKKLPKPTKFRKSPSGQIRMSTRRKSCTETLSTLCDHRWSRLMGSSPTTMQNLSDATRAS